MNTAGTDVHYPPNKVALIAYSAPFASVSTGMSNSIVIVQIIVSVYLTVAFVFPFLGVSPYCPGNYVLFFFQPLDYSE